MIIAGPGTGKTRTLTRRIAAAVAGGVAARGLPGADLYPPGGAGDARAAGGADPAGGGPADHHHFSRARPARSCASTPPWPGWQLASPWPTTGCGWRWRPRSPARTGRPAAARHSRGGARSRTRNSPGPWPRAAWSISTAWWRLPLALLRRSTRPWRGLASRALAGISVDEYQDIDAEPVRAAPAAGRRRQRADRHRRPRPGDLRVPGCGRGLLPAFRRRLPSGGDGPAGPELPVGPGDRRGRPAGRRARHPGARPSGGQPATGARPGRCPGGRITLHECPSEQAEAAWIAGTIDRLLGGSSFHSLDTGRADGMRAPGWRSPTLPSCTAPTPRPARSARH